MNTLLSTFFVLAFLAWLATRRTAAAVAAFFLLFSLITRTLALVYVDLGNPIYAIEMYGDVGGGQSMPLFACAVMAFMLPLAVLFRPAQLDRLLPRSPALLPPRTTSRRLAFYGLALFFVLLYADMLYSGPIPLFAGIDRLDYNLQMGDSLHGWLMDFGFLFATALGILAVYPRLRGKEFDLRFLYMYFAAIVYFALSGNRFSAFYSFTSFFMIPFAALFALQRVRRLLPPPPGRSLLVRLMCSRATLVGAVGAMGLAISALLIYNVTAVRGYDDPAEQLSQRILVQPVQLWWVTWSDLQSSFNEADLMWDGAFGNPIEPTRNTSIQALMIKYLGDERARDLMHKGQQYAGGYPEILFELFGTPIALLIALAFGTVTAFLLRFIVVSVTRGYLLTAIFAAYIFYGFSLLYIGGMLNFLLPWTFWVKIGALVLTWLAERRYLRRAPFPPSSPVAAA